MGAPELSVVIPTYRRRDRLCLALVALAEQTLAPERYEVIVSIDGGADGTRELVERFPAPYALRGLWNPHRGRAATRNAGVAAARGRLIVLLDDDMQPAPELLAAHLAAHAAAEPRLVLGPVPIRLERDSPLGGYFERRFAEHLERLGSAGHRYTLRDFYAGNASLPRATLLRAGAFDEQFTGYGNEDVELWARLRRDGVGIVYEPRAVAYQGFDKDFARAARDARDKGRTSVLLAAKHPDVLAEMQLAAYRRRPPWWRAARFALLASARLGDPIPDALLALTRALEAGGGQRPPLHLYYAFSLDCFYWLGVSEARRERAAARRRAGAGAPSSPRRQAPRAPRRRSTAPRGSGAPREVCYFTDSRAYGGAEQALLALLGALDRERWRPVLACHSAEGVTELARRARGMGVEVWPVAPMPEGLEGARRLLPFAAALRRRAPAVFHAHLTWPLACKYPLAAAVLARVPAVVATHHLYPPFAMTRPTLVQQAALGRRLGRIVAVSEDTAVRLRRTFRWPAERVEVIPNGVDVAALRRPRDPALRAELAAGADAVVLALARLDPLKGHRDLLEAARLVPRARFVLAGEGPERPALEAAARAPELGGRVTLLGHRDDVPELLACADVVVLPSRAEGLPLSVLEAMAAARPVVATRIGGTSEAVLDGVTGLLVPPGDAAALAAAIRALLNDPGLARRLGEAGARRVEERFSLAAAAARVSGVYDALLARAVG